MSSVEKQKKAKAWVAALMVVVVVARELCVSLGMSGAGTKGHSWVLTSITSNPHTSSIHPSILSFSHSPRSLLQLSLLSLQQHSLGLQVEHVLLSQTYHQTSKLHSESKGCCLTQIFQPRIDKAASQTTSESTTTSPISIHPSAAPSSSSSPHSSVRKMASSLSVPGGSGSTSPVPLRWRDSARPLPHDVLLQIARYLGDMHAEGDHEARLTLASMMRVSNDSFDAAARTLYEFVTVSRDTFAQVFGGNDTKKSKFLDDPITFPTRASVVRKLGLFQYTKRLYIHDLPSEQAVADLVEAWQVSCSRPSSGVSCREALSGSLFPRLECVSFGPGVFLNSYSMPPLGPEFKGGLHRFLSFLRREGSPIHMCLAYPTPAQVSTYQNEHPGAERPGADETAIPADAVVDPATPGPPLHNPNSLSRADEASWPDALARAWSLETITVHNVRFGRAISTNLVKLPCRRLRIFALESVCGLGVCDDKHCVHCDSRWGRAGSTLQAMARAATEDKDAHSFETLEIANVGAGYALACTCVTEYANAVAYLKGCLCDRTEEAPWTLELPHASEAAACRCCGATVSPIGDTGEGSSRRGIAFNTACVSRASGGQGGYTLTRSSTHTDGRRGSALPSPSLTQLQARQSRQSPPR